MSTNNKQDKPLFKLIVTPKNIFMKAPSPNRNTVIIIALVLLLGIALLIGVNDHELRSKALELVMTIIDAILTFFNIGSKSK